MKWTAIALMAGLAMAQSDAPAPGTVSAVRTWSLSEATRIAVEVSREFEYRSDRLHNPERVYYDILNASPWIESRRTYSKDLTDKLVSRVRVAETQPGITRIVLDLRVPVEVTASQLANPNRLIIELRAASKDAPSSPPSDRSAVERSQPGVANGNPVNLDRQEATAAPGPPAAKPAREGSAKPEPAPKADPPKSQPRTEAAPGTAVPEKPAAVPSAPTPGEPGLDTVPKTTVAAKPAEVAPAAVAPAAGKAAAAAPAPPDAAEFSTAARKTSNGQNSLTRVLGLKMNRVVIDPGHGGHDQGTEGPKGLLEKDVVLDVALRLGKLIESGLGAQVIFTRSDDTFIPLAGRTAIANDNQADLFLSIHANSSPVPKTAGVETYYLNFTTARDALEVAARENAASSLSVFELQDVVKKITLQDKIDESREFASRIQAALYAFSERNIPGSKNRGLKKAPFVVLIGAHMPSVLAEIGFLTNPKEESQLKKPDYRQKVAEALYRGVSKYAESLSHFQVAQADDDSATAAKGDRAAGR